jgi:oxaloacetate decarboxylase alpha subunit
LNVLTGERYKIITKETRQCLLGNYGKLPAAINEELLAKVSKDGKITSCRPADLLEPEWDTVCKELGDKYTSEDDRLTYALFGKVALSFFETRGKPQPEPAAKVPAPGKAPPPTATASAGPAVYKVRVNGKDYTVEVSTGGAAVASAIAPAATAPAPVAAPTSGGGSPLVAPLPGSIFSLRCNEGDAVNEGDTVLVMESMKMESEIVAHQSGTIQSILVKEGDTVQTGDELVVIG